MSEIELKPCPFCGSTSLKVESKHNGQWSDSGTHSATVRCKKCYAVCGEEPLFGHRSGKQAKTHWLCFMKEEER